MASGDFIPVVDFEGVLSCSDLSTCAQVQQLHTAFTQVGFVFIKNHGIHKELVSGCAIKAGGWVVVYFAKTHPFP